MAAAPYILARTFAEAHAFAREDLGLLHGQYRVVTSAGTLKAVRNVDLYLAPGWDRRYDRFQMKAALRWSYMNVIDWEKQQAEAPADQTPDGLEPAGVQQELTDGADPALVQQFEAFLNGGEHPHEEKTSLSPEEIAALESNLEPEGWEPPATLDADQILRLAAGESGSDVAPVEVPEQPAEPVRRRRRCKECGLLVDPDELESHAAEHLPNEG